MSKKPYEGIRIIDPTHVLAGPFCCYQMAWFGAEVIKIEAVEPRDFIRYASPEADLAKAGLSEGFLAQNANKKSVVLNLKDPRGQDLFKRLAATSDAMVENFQPGTMAGLGLGYDDIRAINPKLVYCSLTGFGQTGPLRDVPAYDHLVQGISAMASMQNGTTDPVRVGFPVIDYVVGLLGAFALSTALFQARASGQGQYVDVSMLDSALVIMAPVVQQWLTSQRVPQSTGRRAFSGSPFSGIFETAEGMLVTAANTRAQAESVLRVIGREDLIDDPDVLNWQGRPEVSDRVQPILFEAFATRTALEWEALLGAASVPAGKLRDVPEIMAHPHVQERGLLHTIPDVPGIGRPIEVMGPGFRMADPASMVSNPTPPPLKGADTRHYLREVGLSDADIDGLVSDGVTLVAD